MTIDDRIRWDYRYREKRGAAYPAPDPLLFQYTPPVTRPRSAQLSTRELPRALDLACGLGQNGLWLAEQGYSVDLIDISREALLIAQAQAAQRGLRSINFLQSDLDDTALQNEAYDLVCVFRFLQRSNIDRLRACVKPGGRVIYATFTTGWRTVMPDAPYEFLLRPGELADYFADWRVLYQRESDTYAEIAALKPETP